MYSLPIFAVATNVTPSATSIVGAPSASSKRKYLWPSSKTVINMLCASGCALDNSSNSMIAPSVCIALTNKASEKKVPSSLLKCVLPIRVALGSCVAPKLK